MKRLLQVGSVSALLFTGCASDFSNLLETNFQPNTQKTISFKTNQAYFMHTLKENATQQERNAYLDEFILESDMQCQNYLNAPLTKPQVDERQNSLYQSMFDIVANLFGISVATDAAKAVFLENNQESLEEKKAYVNALTPEIRKGVEIGRSRFAQMMKQKERLDIKAYSVNDLREDILKYDQLCNDAYGLIEINRALKAMQNSMQKTPPATQTPTIDPKTIKAKVEEATKEVKEKKIEKKIEKEQALKTKQVAPKQPTPENAPQHHDNVRYSPRSLQI